MTARPAIWHDARPMGGTATTGGVTVGWAVATDVGNERSVNEDSAFASPPVFVVADGMGGHRAGDVASALVVDRFGSIGGDRLWSVDEVVSALADTNAAIIDEGLRSVERTGMGTTAVGLALVDNHDAPSWLVFNVGDSRAYCWADGELEQLSVDHSYVQELVEQGQITASSARTHPHRNVVTRVLGTEDCSDPDLWLRIPRVGERYLLCSDGLTSEVEDEAIARVLVADDPAFVATALVELALLAGGRDNVTVIVVDVLDVTGDEIEITSPRDMVLETATPEPAASADPGPGIESDRSVGGDDGLIDRVPAQAELVAADDLDGDAQADAADDVEVDMGNDDDDESDDEVASGQDVVEDVHDDEETGP